jgi:tRNA threonylcarbamoyladenosine biosynthesis protein TsaE
MSEQMIVESNSPEETEELGSQLGRRLKGGEIIELISDLGGGKTTFVRGLAKGAGSLDHVSSPTFTVNKIYKSPKFDISHFDFYRLIEAGILTHELEDLLTDQHSVIIIEWGEAVKHVLPEKRLTVGLEPLGTGSREIRLSAPTSLKYLLED